jgi:hypothetical protein
VKTDDLIESLAGELTPVSPRAPGRRLALGAAVGGALAVVLVATWLRIRPDLAEAMGGATFWMKAGYAAVLGAAGFWCAERLARPAGSGRGGLVLALAAFGVLGALGIGELVLAPAEDRMALWLGQSWRRCPFNILTLSVPALALALAIVRRLAPTRLTAAGAGAGLMAGGVAALAYGLHCPETEPAFVATWYSLGVALSTAAGALLGPWVLRWR